MPCRPCMSTAPRGTEQRGDRFSIVPSPQVYLGESGEAVEALRRPLISRTFISTIPRWTMVPSPPPALGVD
ncbi:hypothetical protein CORC01_06326 [Colletotrichum orchidophilum]|uniref:Uncharacterized protein n=1 Tax=Colletotrichum orchidophilum TaxID=1209926 RepID=A0A1G4BA92_9PEZI|nr:uncharacterized protein CORC01_06326 [Colletotrichum orchidophilum]OHE98330.1 hypothetical protein CORC01_06326 [Colletotrichum orchidophilum]